MVFHVFFFFTPVREPRRFLTEEDILQKILPLLWTNQKDIKNKRPLPHVKSSAPEN